MHLSFDYDHNKQNPQCNWHQYFKDFVNQDFDPKKIWLKTTISKISDMCFWQNKNACGVLLQQNNSFKHILE